MAILDPRMAGQGTEPPDYLLEDLTAVSSIDPRYGGLLPCNNPGDRMGHLILLGGEDGIVGHQTDRSDAVQGGILPCNDSRRTRKENE